MFKSAVRDVALLWVMKVGAYKCAHQKAICSLNNTLGNGLKLYQGRHRLYVRKNVFSTRKDGKALEQASQGSGVTVPVAVQKPWGCGTEKYG